MAYAAEPSPIGAITNNRVPLPLACCTARRAEAQYSLLCSSASEALVSAIEQPSNPQGISATQLLQRCLNSIRYARLTTDLISPGLLVCRGRPLALGLGSWPHDVEDVWIPIRMKACTRKWHACVDCDVRCDCETALCLQ